MISFKDLQLLKQRLATCLVQCHYTVKKLKFTTTTKISHYVCNKLIIIKRLLSRCQAQVVTSQSQSQSQSQGVESDKNAQYQSYTNKYVSHIQLVDR